MENLPTPQLQNMRIKLKDKIKLIMTKKRLMKIAFAEADKEKIMEAVQAGVNQYIVKPFNAVQLEEKIKAIKF